MILTYDLETTGFIERKFPLNDPRQPRIVQLGAILDYPDGREAMRLDVIIAVANVPEGAAKVHGITTETSQKIGLNEDRAIELFLDMLDVAEIVVGQNIKGYDNDLIIGASRRVVQNEAFDPFAGKHIFDTMLAGQALCRIPWRGGGYKKPNLGELHRHLFNGQDFEGAHAAINDVLAARRCFYEMQRLVAARQSHESTAQ